MLKFYYAKNSAAFAPHILLEDIRADYEAVQIDMQSGEQRSESYLAINPKGRLPSLVTDKGILTETPAILLYLAQIFPEHKLAPVTPFELANALAFNLYIASTVHVAHAHKHRGHRWTDDDAAQESMRAKVCENMTECARVIETNYFKGPWVLGSEYSICDPYLALATRWFRDDGVDLDTFELIGAHDSLMRQRASMQRVLALHS